MYNIETTRNYDAIRDMYNILNALKEYDAEIYVSNHGLECPSNFCAEILIEDLYRIEIEFYGNDRYMFYLRYPCYLKSNVDSSLGVVRELKRFIKECKEEWCNKLYESLNNSTSVTKKEDVEKMLKYYIKRLYDVVSRSINTNVDELDENNIKMICCFAKRIDRIDDYLQSYR